MRPNGVHVGDLSVIAIPGQEIGLYIAGVTDSWRAVTRQCVNLCQQYLSAHIVELCTFPSQG